MTISEENSTMNVQHLVVGGEEILECQKLQTGMKYSDLPITFIFVDGSPWTVLEAISERMASTMEAACISGMIWRHMPLSMTFCEAEAILNKVNDLNARHPKHRLAIPHVLYSPAREKQLSFLLTLNEMIKRTNEKNNLPHYTLCNVGAHTRRNGTVKITERYWAECGHLLSSPKAKLSYVKHILNYHKFLCENSTLGLDLHSPREDATIDEERVEPVAEQNLEVKARGLDVVSEELSLEESR